MRASSPVFLAQSVSVAHTPRNRPQAIKPISCPSASSSNLRFLHLMRRPILFSLMFLSSRRTTSNRRSLKKGSVAYINLHRGYGWHNSLVAYQTRADDMARGVSSQKAWGWQRLNFQHFSIKPSMKMEQLVRNMFRKTSWKYARESNQGHQRT